MAFHPSPFRGTCRKKETSNATCREGGFGGACCAIPIPCKHVSIQACLLEGDSWGHPNLPSSVPPPPRSFLMAIHRPPLACRRMGNPMWRPVLAACLLAVLSVSQPLPTRPPSVDESILRAPLVSPSSGLLSSNGTLIPQGHLRTRAAAFRSLWRVLGVRSRVSTSTSNMRFLAYLS